MTDRRCGTCRNWANLNNGWGRCAVLTFGNCRGEHAETPAVAANCPAWSDGTEYARGWRDAVAAVRDAADAVEPVYPRDTQYCQLGDAVETKMAIVAAIAALTPPG